MAQVYKVLGQDAPPATTANVLYTVPSATNTIISTLVVANRGGVADTFRLAVRPAGAALADKHYIAYDTPIPSNETISLTLGMSLGATDVITVYGGSANISFTAFGVEIV